MREDEIPFEGLEELVDKFLLDRKKEYVILTEALNNKEFNTIKDYMHKWKGFCRPYGFGPLVELSVDLETYAIEKSYPNCEKKLAEIKKYLDSRSLKST